MSTRAWRLGRSEFGPTLYTTLRIRSHPDTRTPRGFRADTDRSSTGAHVACDSGPVCAIGPTRSGGHSLGRDVA